MTSQLSHAACVDACLQRSAAKGLPRDALLDFFEAALGALWARTITTLGEVTLSAIADRVLHDAGERYPEFASLTVDPNGRLHAPGLREGIETLHHLRLLDAMRFVLVEFLTVLGSLTAEILTPELHAELSQVALSRNGTQASRRAARVNVTTEGKD